MAMRNKSSSRKRTSPPALPVSSVRSMTHRLPLTAQKSGATGTLVSVGRDRPIDHDVLMTDAEDVRRIAMSLPGVVEIDSDGFDFRVGNKGFVWSYPERIPGQRRVLRTDIAVVYVGDEAEKQALVLGEPDLFFTTSSFDGWPLVLARLDTLDSERLTELVTDAWRMRAEAIDGLAEQSEQSG